VPESGARRSLKKFSDSHVFTARPGALYARTANQKGSKKMNTLTAIITTIVLATSIAYNTVTTPTDGATLIGPPATATAGDTIDPGGPPPTFDGGGDEPTCLSCN
jgi:hypothetical protein